jgi:hypothetical protein
VSLLESRHVLAMSPSLHEKNELPPWAGEQSSMMVVKFGFCKILLLYIILQLYGDWQIIWSMGYISKQFSLLFLISISHIYYIACILQHFAYSGITFLESPRKVWWISSKVLAVMYSTSREHSKAICLGPRSPTMRYGSRAMLHEMQCIKSSS